jgi:3-hydroxyacyl-[acyl-carrier-protein] dehydratase
MILKDHFYTIQEISNENNTVRSVIQLNAEHPIFGGHFPGQPVVPGVCMLQMIKELLETTFSSALRLSKGNELKFLNVIDPTKNRIISVELEYAGDENVTITVNGKLFVNETVFFKCKGVFVAG